MSLYRRFKDRFGTAGVVLGVIALILALGGSALAAKGAFTGKQKKEIAKIAKKEAMKYANSNPGAPGAPGTNGTNGANGAPGKSVLLSNTAPGCAEGGITVEIEGSGTPTEVCDGVEGPQGTPGTNGHSVLNGTAVPTVAVGSVGDFYIKTGATPEIFGPKAASGANGGWGTGTSLKGPAGPEGVCATSSCHLPSGVTETGTVALVGELVEPILPKGKSAQALASFNIPVEPAPTAVYVLGTKTGFGSNSAAGCPGVTTENVPQADSGKFCVYMHGEEIGGVELPPADVEARSPAGTGVAGLEKATTPAGAILQFSCPSGGTFESCSVAGLWAVTG